MQVKHRALAAALVILLASFAQAGLTVAGGPGSGPADALPVPSGPQTVQPGQRIWYGFRYAGDNSPISIRMNANPSGAAKFSVWSGNDVLRAAHGDKESPMGRSAANSSYFGGDEFWTGGSRGPGIYYVVVDGAGPVPGSYTLTVAGSGVGVLPAEPTPAAPAPALPAIQPVRPVQPAAAYVFTRIPPTATRPAPGPDLALPVPGEVQTLGPGERIWYAFRYAGDNSPISLRMNAPAGTTKFAVWSPTDVQRWAQGGKENPTGRGAANALFGGDLVWAGNSRQPGTYYIVVDQALSGPGSYKLSVSGSGVSAPAAPSATATPQPPPPPAVAPPSAARPVFTPYVFTRPSPTPTPIGQNPDGAVPVPSGPETLGVGRRIWYAFPYGGGDGSILVRLSAGPAGSAKFAVWSPEDVRRWAGGAKEQPMGRGAPNSRFGGDLIWVGNPKVSGTYYVVVDQEGPVPTTYTVSVNTAYR